MNKAREGEERCDANHKSGKERLAVQNEEASFILL
jgi:hypothetical protein